MIEFKIHNIALRIDFSFFAILFIYFSFDSSTEILAISACIIHELSHLLLMAILHVPIKAILFYGAGIRISAMLDTSKCEVKSACLAAGVAANFVVSVVAFVMGEYLFSAVNLVTGMFNLLPVGEFDGAQLLKMALLKNAKPEKVDGIMKRAGFISIGLCFIGIIIISGCVRLMVLAVFLYLLIIVYIS